MRDVIVAYLLVELETMRVASCTIPVHILLVVVLGTVMAAEGRRCQEVGAVNLEMLKLDDQKWGARLPAEFGKSHAARYRIQVRGRQGSAVRWQQGTKSAGKS